MGNNLYSNLVNFYNVNDENFKEFMAELYKEMLNIHRNVQYVKEHLTEEIEKKLEIYLVDGKFNINIEEKVNEFLENNQEIEDINTKLNTNTSNIGNITSQLDTIEIKKADQTSFNNLKNQVNNLVLESGGDSNLEVVQSRSSNGFRFKTLSSRLDNYESIIKEGKFEIEFYDLVNNSVTDGEVSNPSPIRITTTSKYDISSLTTIHLRLNKLSSKQINYNNYYYDNNETLISSSLITQTKIETSDYYEYIIDVTNADYVRFLFKFSDDSTITENDIYENVRLYFYTDDRTTKLYDELGNMCYDSLGNKFDTPSELIKDLSSIVSYNNNIFDKNSPGNVDGYINGGAGGIDNSTNYKTSYFISLKKRKKYIISPKIRKFLAYDENKNPIVSSYVDATTNNFVFTMEDSWSYIRFTCYASDFENMMLSPGETPLAYVKHGYAFGKDISFNDYQKEEIKEIVGTQGNKLENKILFNFGDSIATGDGNNGKGYAELFATKYNMICYDFAVGGATLGDTASNNITSQVDTAIANGISPDYILIEGGTNDIINSVALGSMTTDYSLSNFVKTTTSGGLEYCLYKLKETYPNAKIIFVSVHKMSSRDYTKQTECQKRCIEICNKWGVPVADIGNSGNLNTFLPSMHKFTIPTDTQPNGDRTHPNQLGYETFYLPIIYKILSSI